MPEPGAGPVAAEDRPEEVVACLKPMIDDLPEKYRQAIVLTEYENLTQKEMSQKLGLSLARIHRWTGMDGVRTAEGVRELQAR